MSERPEEADDPRDDGADRDAATSEARRPATPVTQQLGRIVVLILLVVFIVFAVSNAQRVDFSWVFGGTEVAEDAAGETTGGVPLIVLLLAAFVIGALTGAMVVRIGNRRRARAAAGQED